MSAKYKSPSFLLPNELNTSANTANDTGINSLYSMKFDGSNSVNCGNISALNGATQATWSCWYKKTATGAKYFMGTWGSSTSERQFIAYQFSQSTTSAMYVNMGSSAGANRLMFQNTSDAEINLNTWYHMAFVYDESESSNADKLKFYLNGTPITNQTAGFALTSLNTVTNSFILGAPIGQPLTGNLDEVAIFNRALNTTEIAALYGGTSPNIYPSNLMASNLGPIAYYPLGEQAQNSGYPGSATPANNVWQFPNGVLQDYVMDFDGSSDYISLSGDTLINTTSPFSISGWFNLDSIDSGGYSAAFALKTNSNHSFVAYISNQGGYAGVAFGEAGSGNAINTSTNVSSLFINKWANLTITYNGSGTGSSSNYNLYINGQAQTLTSNSGFAGYGNVNLLGYYHNTGFFNGFNGSISNLALWSSDQSTNKDNIYNNGSPQTSYTVTPQNWWKLNADSVYNLGIGLDGFDGADNTGGGAGGGGSRYAGASFYVGNGGQGGSGIVVLKYPTILNPDFSSDLTISSSIDGSNTLTYITKGTGTITFDNAGTISDYLIVAGGGGGGSAVNNGNGEASGGGGGGGGLLTGTSLSVSAQSYNITIGEGGAGGLKTMGSTIGNQGENGQDSIFSTLTAVGGGGGGAGQASSNALSAGKNGGSGGGPGGSSGASTSAGGTGSQGSDGGAASNKRAAGGGGGYSSAGSNATSNSVPGDGGNGYLYSLTNTYYAGGGGGGVWYMSGSITDGGSAGDGSTGTGGAPKQQGDITPVGPNFSNWWKIPSALPIQTPSYTQALNFNNGSGVASDWIFYNQIPGTTDPFTFSIWFKQNETNSQASKFLSFRNNFVPTLDVTNNVLRFGIWDGGFRNVSYTIQNEKWNLITCGVDPSTNTIFAYLNGGNKKTTSYSGTRIDSAGTDGIYLGRCRDGSFNVSWKGELSSFAWFNYVLPETGTESVQSIYNLGTPKDITGWSNNYLWYKLNSTTITDSSGNNRTGTNNNATLVSSDVLATQPVNGVSTTLPSTALQQSDLQFDSPYSNYSLSFDGTGQYINCGTSNISELQVLSLSCWFKEVDSSNTGTRAIIANKNYSSNNGVALWIFGSDLVFQIAAQNDNLSWNNSRVVIFRNYAPIGSWHHISCTYDGTDAKIYINGVLRNTWTPTQPYTVYYSPTYNELRIANRSDTTGAPFVGKIDETAIFNTALTEAQVLEIYNNGKPGNLDNFSGTAPISWWRLGENAYFNTGTTPGPEFTVPNSIAGAPNGVGSGTVTTMLSADAPGTYANGIGTNLDITDRVGDAPLSVANSQSYNMIPDDKVPYVPGYVGAQTTNAFEMTFDGVDDYFNAGDFSSLIDQTVSVSMWFKTTSTFSSNEDLLSFGLQTTGSVSTQRIFFASSGILVASINNGSGGYATTSYSGLNDGDWHHLVCMWEGGSVANGIKIYVDGSLADQVNSTQSLTSAVQFIIGENLHYNSNFDGSIDEVAIFDKALTADQVKFDLYEPTALVGGVEKTADIENNTNLPTPVAWYRMGD